MNSNLWTCIREYIASEVELAVIRHSASLSEHLNADHKRIRELEEQSTRMEDEIRKQVAA